MNALRKARLEKGLTIEDLAKASKVSPATISRIENGKLKITQGLTLTRLANVLGVPVETFFNLLKDSESIDQSPNPIAA